MLTHSHTHRVKKFLLSVNRSAIMARRGIAQRSCLSRRRPLCKTFGYFALGFCLGTCIRRTCKRTCTARTRGTKTSTRAPPSIQIVVDGSLISRHSRAWSVAIRGRFRRKIKVNAEITLFRLSTFRSMNLSRVYFQRPRIIWKCFFQNK